MGRLSRFIVPAVSALLIAAGSSAKFAAAASAQPEAPVAGRIMALQAKLLDPASRFELDATLAELDKLEPDTVPGSAERGRVEYLRGFLFWKAERFGPAIDHDQVALAIDAAHAFLTASERVHLNDTLGQMAVDEGDPGLAVDAYRRTLALVGADPAVTTEQRLALQEKLAFCLHEAGRFAEARTLNEATLAAQARLDGPESPKLAPVLNNLAQNQYALKDDDAAEATLQRLLTIATRADDAEHTDNALRQLAALSYETGHGERAREFLVRRLGLAQSENNPVRLAKARADLATLDDKMREAAR